MTRRTGNAKVMGSIPVEAQIFFFDSFRLLWQLLSGGVARKRQSKPAASGPLFHLRPRVTARF